MNKYLLAVGLSLLPLVSFAQATPVPVPKPASLNRTLGSSINDFIGFLNDSVVPLIFAIAFIVFIWYVFTHFIAGAADEEKLSKGRQFVLWAVIGFFVMFSIWGLVNIAVSSVGLDTTSLPPPTFGN